VRRAPDSQEQPEELRDYLLRSADELRGAVVFPTRDFDLLFLDHFRADLSPCYRLCIPSHECLGRVLDKQKLMAVAKEAGVSVPRTMKVSSGQDLLRVACEVSFPCVVKPVSSSQWRTPGSWTRVGGRTAFLVRDLLELQEEYQRVSSVLPDVLIQEWIPGPTGQIAVLGGYVDEGGEPLTFFTAYKVLQSSDDFGTGCIVRSEEIPELLEPTIRLWRALEYQGMAEVEYKYDSRNGEHKLIEINARHWDQHHLGSARWLGKRTALWYAYRGRSDKQWFKMPLSSEAAIFMSLAVEAEGRPQIDSTEGIIRVAYIEQHPATGIAVLERIENR
jgi:D-aspartate ligase